MATHLGASTTNVEGTHRGHQACQVVPRPLDSLPTHTGVERKLPRSHGLQGCYPRSIARTSPPSKVCTCCTVSVVHGHIRRSRAPPSACTATVVGLPLPDPTTIARSNRLAPRGGRGKGEHCLHQLAATERDQRINHHRIRKGDGGRGSSRGLTTFHAALTRSTRHAAFTVQVPSRATDVLTSRCNRRERQRKGEQPRPTGGLPDCCSPATPPPHVQPSGERAQTPTTVESGCRAARSSLLALPTGRIQLPRAARCRLTAEEDEPQSDLQARCPTGAVRPPPRSPTQKNTPRTPTREPHRKRRGEPHRHLPCSRPRVVPRGQLRRRRGGGGGRE
jgi:hypothetical protein